jgi:hypothetical protein
MRAKRTILAGAISLGSKNLRSTRRSCWTRWEPFLTCLVWVRIRLYHNVGLWTRCRNRRVISTLENVSQKHSWHHFGLAESFPNPMTGWFTDSSGVMTIRCWPRNEN